MSESLAVRHELETAELADKLEDRLIIRSVEEAERSNRNLRFVNERSNRNAKKIDFANLPAKVGSDLIEGNNVLPISNTPRVSFGGGPPTVELCNEQCIAANLQKDFVSLVILPVKLKSTD